MANKKLKERKKKNREKKAKETVLVKRKAWRDRKKQDKKLALLEKKTRDRLEPYMHPDKRAIFTSERDKQIRDKLEHNMEILKALEEQYNKDQQERKERNEQLQAEGCETLQDKINYMGQKATENSIKEEEEN
jgi:hypothetical protein